MKKTVLVGVTSGIAAYKTLDLIKLLKKKGIEVFVIMTKNATQMIPIKKFEQTSGNKVFFELFEKDFDYRQILKSRKVDHIELADRTDLLVIVPATANIIGKLAHGIADDFLTTTALAINKPIIICPSMNVNMWENPIVQENISKLKKIGHQIIEPATGMLACGYEGKGRLEKIEVIYEEIINALNKTESLKGKKIIVTAGGTIEKIDEVRYIANRSSGRMGAAIAEECYLRGAQVLLLRAKNSVQPRYLINEKIFTDADSLLRIIKENIKNYDIFFHTAAVSDFKVADPFLGKISSKASQELKLIRQIKILDQIKKLSPKIKLVAFKAEYNLPEKDLIDVSYKRLKKCQADVIIANDVSKNDRGFEADTNEVYLIFPNKTFKKIPLSSKKEIARNILDCFQTTSNDPPRFVNILSRSN